MSKTKKVENDAPVVPEPTVDPNVIVTPPEIDGIVEPVIATEGSVPVGTVQRTETEVQPLVEPVAIVPGLIYEQTAPVSDGLTDAPQVLTTKGKNATRVEIICDTQLGSKLLKKGDITDDDEYVALLETERGRHLVKEVE